MSRSLCSLSAPLRRFSTIPKGSTLAPPRTASGIRRYSSSAFKTRTESDTRVTPQRLPPRRQKNLEEDAEDDFDSRGMAALDSGSNWTGHPAAETLADSVSKDETPSVEQKSTLHLVEHLNGLFPPLQFPPDLARRILTHGSHPSAIHGHNAGLRFIGRRVIESYLLLFLNSSSALKPTHDLDAILARTANTYTLGEHVGSSWGLGRALRWSPAVPASHCSSTPDAEKLLRGVGLYKVQGDAVAAVMGGIYYQFGASMAQRVFHTHILPKLLLGRRPEGLPETFHAEAKSMCKRMGGLDGQLTLETPLQRTEAIAN
ncbi:hypothetical protein AX17_001812 [Amanita inopinata Kibby_2008]|nr:hypothetical protein AX17_001812 [Amanita inopinata Kibby_2008]